MGTALVTGASSGIGRAFAVELADRGHDLVVVARDRARLEDLSDELTATYGVSVEILTADLSVRSQVDKVAERLSDPDRPVDLLVNNAGFGVGRSFVRGDLAQEEAMLDVLCRAVLVLSKAAVTGMRERAHGAVLNVASVAAYFPTGTYSAAKMWCIAFTEALSQELRGSGVTAMVLNPGFTRTEFQERAGIRSGGLPDVAWLDAGYVARQGLADLAAGKVVSVPSARYKAVVALSAVVPRPIARRAGSSLNALRRGRRRPAG